MGRKILFCATVDYHFRAFHLPMMEWFQRRGWEVHVAAKGELELPFADRKFQLPFARSPLRPDNLKAYRKLKSLIEREQYDLIHCHTPTAGALTRLAARHVRQNGAKVLYTAHGFHFHKGGPLASWLLYYPVEKWLASLTDCLITINSEDYTCAASRGFRAGQIRHVHGVGVNTELFKPAEDAARKQLRKKHGYSDDQILMIYAAEFNENKNQELLLHAFAQLKPKAPKARLLLAGEGPKQEACKRLAAQLGIAHMVDFLGYRQDMGMLLPMCDVAVASSFREGLPVNIMEAMACGLPVVAAHNRGHAELIEEGRNGFLVPHGDSAVFASRLQLLCDFKDSRLKMGRIGAEKVKTYSLANVREELAAIYQSFITEAPNEAEDQYRRAYL